MEKDAAYPNRLRELRVAEFLTREQLAARTVELEAADALAYAAVSARSLERLEQGRTRPRIRVASALAKALAAAPGDVFPYGPDDGVRNPEGNTRIPPDRPTRGPGRRKKA